LIGQPFVGSSGNGVYLAFSPDGSILASGNDSGTIRLFNVADPAHPTLIGQPLTGGSGSLVSLAFSPDGHTLASGSSTGPDGTIQFWALR
jgi:WD40 repeat protein